MYTIIEVGGKQFKVSEGDEINVPKLPAEAGKSIELKDVLVYTKNGKIEIGAPKIKKALVKAKVLGDVKGEKLVIFKMKRRKGYRRKTGHRQAYTKLLIEKIKVA